MGIDFDDVKRKMRGPCVSFMAPFKDSLELNIEALKENIRFVVDGGITNGEGHIICPGGAGEYTTLSHEEHKKMVEAAVEVVGNKVLVVAGVTSNNYKEVIELSLNAAEAGAKCVMIPPPHYYPISQEGIYRWYKVIAEGTKNKIGIMVYHQPWRAEGTFISMPLLGKLAGIENIVSMKYGGESLTNYIAALGLYSKRFSFIDNTIPTLTHVRGGAGFLTAVEIAHMYGAAGFLTAPGTFWPEFEAKYWSLLEQGKYQEAAKWHTKLCPFWEYFLSGGKAPKSEVGPGGEGESPLFYSSVFKAALEYVGLYGGPVRPPFIELTKEQKKELFGVLEGIGVSKKR